jgi:hypothetical protein
VVGAGEHRSSGTPSGPWALTNPTDQSCADPLAQDRSNLFLGALSQVSREHCETTSTGGIQRDWNSARQLRIAADGQGKPLSLSIHPQQDSDLRTRLRRALLCMALTSGNVLAGERLGHVLDTGRLAPMGEGTAPVPAVCRERHRQPFALSRSRWDMDQESSFFSAFTAQPQPLGHCGFA